MLLLLLLLVLDCNSKPPDGPNEDRDDVGVACNDGKPIISPEVVTISGIRTADGDSRGSKPLLLLLLLLFVPGVPDEVINGGSGNGDRALRCDTLRTLATLELLLNTLVLTLLVSMACNCGIGDTDVTRVMIGGEAVPPLRPIPMILSLLLLRLLLLVKGVTVPLSTAGNTSDGDGVRVMARVGNGDANRSAISAGTSANDGYDDDDAGLDGDD